MSVKKWFRQTCYVKTGSSATESVSQKYMDSHHCMLPHSEIQAMLLHSEILYSDTRHVTHSKIMYSDTRHVTPQWNIVLWYKKCYPHIEIIYSYRFHVTPQWYNVLWYKACYPHSEIIYSDTFHVTPQWCNVLWYKTFYPTVNECTLIQDILPHSEIMYWLEI